MSEKAVPPALGAKDRIVIFQEQAIRRTWHANEWWFSVIDVVGILSETAIPKRYWSDLKRKLAQEAGSGQPYEKIVRLKLSAPDGKQRETDCASTEILFRIIQSIPSPKAEPFKRWLAQVGYERVKEIEDPELANTRARELYEAKGKAIYAEGELLPVVRNTYKFARRRRRVRSSAVSSTTTSI